MLMKKIAYWYLTAYTTLLVVVHLLGASGLRVVEYSRNTHSALLAVSLILLIGFFYRARWAFRFGALFYCLHALSFPFEVYERYAKERIVDFYGVGDWLALLMAFIIAIFFAKNSSKHVEKHAHTSKISA